MITRLEQVIAQIHNCPSRLSKLETVPSLVAIVWVAWGIGLEFARVLVESELSRRATIPTQWPDCPHCGTTEHSFMFSAAKDSYSCGMG